jgi:hypothetical protein
MKVKVYTIDFELPRWLKRGVLYVGIPLMALAGAAAVVRAATGFPIPIVDDYKDGDKLTAAGLNTKFNDLRTAANTLATSIDSLQAADSTAQGQISAIGNKLNNAKATLSVRSLADVTASLGANAYSGWRQSNDCDADEMVYGGCLVYAADGSGAANVAITSSYPEGTHWTCVVKNNSATTVTLYVRAACVKAALTY